MWYVLHCQKGKEEMIVNSCRQRIEKNVLMDAFVFTYDRMKLYGGSWHTETTPMFPEYVFLEAEHQESLSEQLEPYREFVQILEDRTSLRRVSPEEEEFLRILCGEQHHLRMSRGIIREGVTHVTQGPLIGQEDKIMKIDRHKRLARLHTPFRRIQDSMVAGLEILEKS